MNTPLHFHKNTVEWFRSEAKLIIVSFVHLVTVSSECGGAVVKDNGHGGG
jgi:hypothetical protein